MQSNKINCVPRQKAVQILLRAYIYSYTPAKTMTAVGRHFCRRFIYKLRHIYFNRAINLYINFLSRESCTKVITPVVLQASRALYMQYGEQNCNYIYTQHRDTHVHRIICMYARRANDTISTTYRFKL